MHQLVRTVFSKLHDLDPDSEEKKLSNAPPPGTDQASPSTDQLSGDDDGATSTQPVIPIDVSGIPKSGCTFLLFRRLSHPS